MNERKLEIFCRVAECTNMTKVAKEMYISQPAVSQTINELESYYKVDLFERIGKKLFITQEGEEVYRYARRIINLHEEARESVATLKEDGEYSLRVGVSHTVGSYMMPQVIARYREMYPNVKLRMFQNNTEIIANMILRNEVDIAFVEGDVESEDIQKEEIKDDEMILIFGNQHRFKGSEDLTLKDIEGEKILMRELGSGTRSAVESFFQTKNINYEIFMEMYSNEAIKNTVSCNLGISYLSKSAVQCELQNESISTCLNENMVFTRKIFFIKHRDKKKNKYIEKLKEEFR